MIRGIIYKYTSPSGKVYVGQTINEQKRRNTFLNLSLSYGGDKIDNARNKYLPENFQYEILEENNYTDLHTAKEELNKLEIHYIDYFDSYRTGYNSALGGGTTTGYKFTEEQKHKMSVIRKGVAKSEEFKQKISNALKNKAKSEEHRKKIAENNKKRSKKVGEYTKDGELLKIYDSITDAANAHNTGKSHISDVIHGRRKTLHKRVFKLIEDNVFKSTSLQ